MQNSAAWISTTPDGYRVRVRFLPMNAQETVRTQRLLRNMTVQTVMVTGEGPLSVDLYFTDAPLASPMQKMTDLEMVTLLISKGYSIGAPVSAPSSGLTAEQQAAMDRPASKV